jgi:hypothetical protein
MADWIMLYPQRVEQTGAEVHVRGREGQLLKAIAKAEAIGNGPGDAS